MGREYDEKRNFMRMYMDCPMKFARADGSEHEAVARDLSSSGLGFTTDQDLRMGEVLIVQLVLTQNVVEPLRAEAEVIRIQAMSAGVYDIGVEIKKFL
ncbi:MAG: PilZ domain-containing protein [Thiohalomonadaceae bacterium]